MMKVNILGCKVDKVTMQETLRMVEYYINRPEYRHIITLNAEIIYKAQSVAKLKQIINEADLVTPDGAGVVWAARKLGDPVPERVTGIDLMEALVKKAGSFIFTELPPVWQNWQQKILRKNIKI